MSEAAESRVSASQREILLVEYEATNAAFIHYDSFRWQVASPLFTGVAVFWGFVLQSDADPEMIGVSGLLVSLLLAAWLLYTDHNRQIYRAKLSRIHEIERLLDMWQHRQWTPAATGSGRPMLKTFGFGGHQLDKAVYVAGSLGASAIAASSGDWSWWLLLPAPVVVAALLATVVWQGRMSTLLREPRDGTAAELPSSPGQG